MYILSIAFGIVVFAGNAHAQNLYFGSLRQRLVKNENCHFVAAVPQLKAGSNSNPTLTGLVSALNTKWAKSLNAALSDYQDTIAPSNQCQDDMSAVKFDVSFSLPAGISSDVTSILYKFTSMASIAHGGTTLGADTFNATTGEVYPNLSVFIDQSKLALLKQLILAKVKEVDTTFDPTFGWTNWTNRKNNISDIDNFYVSDEGIVIYFQEREIGSYAEGYIFATLAWDDLRALGLNDSVAAKILMLDHQD